MAHILTIKMLPRDGMVPNLECTEPDGSPCKTARPWDESFCGLVEMFNWDSAASLEGFYGAEFELCRVPISVTSASEDTFDWELSGNNRYVGA